MAIGLTAMLPFAMACNSDSALGPFEQPPVIATEFVRVPLGTATMPLSVSNQSVVSWDYGDCSYSVDRLEPTGWQVALQQSLCDAVGHSVEPGGSFTWQVPLPDEEGTYRIRFRFVYFPNNLATDVFSVSNTFQIGLFRSPELE